MNEKKVYSNIQERIALDNFKVERVRSKKFKKRVVIAASAATIVFASVMAVKTLTDRGKDE